MANDDKEYKGIVTVVSRQAGTLAGTSVAISKKIAGGGAKTMEAAKDLLKKPLKILTPGNNNNNGAMAEESISELQEEQENVRKSAAKALIETLELDLAVAEGELEKAQSDAEKSQSKLTLQLNELKAEKESLISEISALEEAKSKANETAIREGELKARIAALESDLAVAQHHLEESRQIELDTQFQTPSDLSEDKLEEKVELFDRGGEEFEVESIQDEFEVVSIEEQIDSALEPVVAQSVDELTKIEEQPSQPIYKVEEPDIPAVMESPVETDVFPSSIDNVIFSRVLSDIKSEDVRTRANAVKVIGDIPHELSVKTLVAQLSRETSPQVRQECIKALTRQEVNGGLQAVRRALTDPAASVRLAAVRGLYRLAGDESASDLVHMLSDENEEVCRRSATCIGWLGQGELALELIPLLSNGNPSVRRAAIEAMGNLHSRQVISALIEHLNDPEKSVRRAIIDAMEKITGKKMSGPLPRNEKALQCYIARWHEWWKEELLGR
jgi:HEAT repeat protein